MSDLPHPQGIRRALSYLHQPPGDKLHLGGLPQRGLTEPKRVSRYLWLDQVSADLLAVRVGEP